MQRQLGQLRFADGLVNGATNFISEVATVLDFSPSGKRVVGYLWFQYGSPALYVDSTIQNP